MSKPGVLEGLKGCYRPVRTKRVKTMAMQHTFVQLVYTK